jgi:hypothetical protein
MTMHTRLSSLVVIALSACGSWSNADLEFANALPSRAELKSKIPVTASNTQPLEGPSTRRDPLNVGDPSKAYADAKKAATTFNGIFDFFLGVIDLVRAQPPTTRTTDSRVWGPFPDSNNPGTQFSVIIRAEADASFSWAIRASIGSADAFDVVVGTFKATDGSVKKGQGAMAVHVKNFRDLLKVDPVFKDIDEINITYANDTSPTQVHMVFTFKAGASSGISAIGYEYFENADRSGTLHYQVQSDSTELSVLDTRAGWLQTGAGRTFVRVLQGTYAGFTASECWDPSFKVTFYSEGWTGGVTNGMASSCVAVDGF